MNKFWREVKGFFGRIPDSVWLGVIVIIVVILGCGAFNKIGQWAAEDTARQRQNELARRAAITTDVQTEETLTIGFSLRNGEFFESYNLPSVWAYLHRMYDPNSDTYSCAITESGKAELKAAIRKWDEVYQDVQFNLNQLFPSEGSFAQPVSISRVGPEVLTTEDMTNCEGNLLVITYSLSFGGQHDQGYSTTVRGGDGVLYLTYNAPITETGQASLQTFITKKEIIAAAIDPFIKGVKYLPSKPDLVSPNISDTLGSDVLLTNLLNQIGSRNDTEKIAEMVLYPRDSRSFEVEKEFTSILFATIDTLAAEKGVPVMVSVAGYNDSYAVVKGYLKVNGGGARGDFNAGFDGGFLKLWAIAAGGVDGGAEATYTQDPINVDGGFSNIPIQTLKVYIYLDNVTEELANQ